MRLAAGAMSVIVAGLTIGLEPFVAAGQQSVFRSTVDAVSVPVSVRDKNRPVAGLKASDFDLLDNGVAQEITSTLLEALPVDVTLVLDLSGSVTGRALTQLKDDVQKMGDLLHMNDRVRLITFAGDARDAFGLQPGGARLPLDDLVSGGVTSLYGALAAALIAFPATDRPQLIFALSDGLDSGSFLDADRIVSLARLSSASLYVALVPSSDSSENSVTRLKPGGAAISWRSMGPYVGGPNRSALRDAAARTGGTVYDDPPEKSVPAIFAKVLEEFRTNYVLRYTLQGVPRGGWHTLTIKTRDSRYTVRARPGYDGG